MPRCGDLGARRWAFEASATAGAKSAEIIVIHALQQAQPDRIEPGTTERGRDRGDVDAQFIEQTIGKRVEQQAKRVRHVGGARQPVTTQRVLEVLDAILRIPTSATGALVDETRRDMVGTRSRGAAMTLCDHMYMTMRMHLTDMVTG